MNAQRLIRAYAVALGVGGVVLLVAVALGDPRWLHQLPWLAVLVVVGIPLRGLQVPVSKYSYISQSSLLALAGSLLVGLPATALALAVSTWISDSVWQRKPLAAAGVNIGREVIALAAAYGVYAEILRLSGVRRPEIHILTLPALFFFALAYFVASRTLFYFTLLIRDKLERDERLFILRYELVAYFASIIAAVIVVAAVVAWPPVTWIFIAAMLGAMGLLFKRMLEEAISAEELNKIHAMEAVITSNISLRDSFGRIERLAHRLVDWGDFRIYRRAPEGYVLAYRSAEGRPGRGDPSPDTVVLRQQVIASGETAVIHDVGRDRRVADAPPEVQTLVIVPLRFGDDVIGTLEIEHHKRRSYRSSDVVTITTFANQLATAIHISDLRRPLTETVERMTAEIAALSRTAESLRDSASAVAEAVAVIRTGVVGEEAEVAAGLSATEGLAAVARRVSDDGSRAATSSREASEVAERNRERIRDAIERLVTLKTFVGESSAKVQALGAVSRRITGFIASIRELADMTNLLALNAAIEAARAGKHGKGFAVVADEVRALAVQSAAAAREAAGLVEAVHRQVGEVVEQMRRGQATVGGVEELSAGALEALDQIVTATADATEHARSIAGVAGAQDEQFAQLRQRMSAVAALAWKNRTEAEDVATRAQDAAHGLSELERATQALERVASTLREITRGFAGAV